METGTLSVLTAGVRLKQPLQPVYYAWDLVTQGTLVKCLLTIIISYLVLGLQLWQILEETKLQFYSWIFSVMEAKFRTSLVTILTTVSRGSARRWLESFVKVGGVLLENSFTPSFGGSLSAHCESGGADVCTECSGPAVCPVNDICYCSSDCFTTGHCCPDVEHLLPCLGRKDNTSYENT